MKFLILTLIAIFIHASGAQADGVCARQIKNAVDSEFASEKTGIEAYARFDEIPLADAGQTIRVSVKTREGSVIKSYGVTVWDNCYFEIF